MSSVRRMNEILFWPAQLWKSSCIRTPICMQNIFMCINLKYLVYILRSFVQKVEFIETECPSRASIDPHFSPSDDQSVQLPTWVTIYLIVIEYPKFWTFCWRILYRCMAICPKEFLKNAYTSTIWIYRIVTLNIIVALNFRNLIHQTYRTAF